MLKQKKADVVDVKEFVARGMKANTAVQEAVVKAKKLLKKKPEPKYLSAEELGITKTEHKYLLKTAEFLKTISKKKHVEIHGQTVGFNLSHWYERDFLRHADCGAVACVKGWGHLLAKQDNVSVWGSKVCDKNTSGAISDSRHSTPLNDIFMPEFTSRYVDYDTVSPKAASKAIIGFLETGVPAWPKSYGFKPRR